MLPELCEAFFYCHSKRVFALFYHLHTNPLENGIIFQDEEERKVAINFIAIIAREFNVEILVFALMNNHFHFIIRGEKVNGIEFFRRLKKRLSYFLARKGRANVLDPVEPKALPITTLTQFRNEVAYVIRNPYVVIVDVNPFSYPWCSGYLYFNPLLPFLESKPVDALTYREKRNITRSSDAALDSSFRVRNGMIALESFVNYRLVEQLFPNARKFTWWVIKNVESQVETAIRLGEHPNLSDDELYITTMRICEDQYNKKGNQGLTDKEKMDLAITLKNNWYASNPQVARLSGLTIDTVNALFPLAAKSKG